MEQARIEEKYQKIAEKVMDEHQDLQWIRKAEIRICYMASDAVKRRGQRLVAGECIKVRDIYRPLVPYEFLIVIYEDSTAGMSEEQLEILMYHELLHIGIDEKGEEVKYIVNPHDVEDFRAVIDQYGLDWSR